MELPVREAFADAMCPVQCQRGLPDSGGASDHPNRNGMRIFPFFREDPVEFGQLRNTVDKASRVTRKLER